jgi:hypothetical protein
MVIGIPVFFGVGGGTQKLGTFNKKQKKSGNLLGTRIYSK